MGLAICKCRLEPISETFTVVHTESDCPFHGREATMRDCGEQLCVVCGGVGEVEIKYLDIADALEGDSHIECDECKGTGIARLAWLVWEDGELRPNQ